jgi:hypothetical protein
VFRRSRSTDEGSGQDAGNGSGAASSADDILAKPHAVTAGKGRPTPKRSEAERRRRQPYTAPRDRKEAARTTRDRQRTDRARRMEAVRRGEEWALPPRDRGPVRALARDYVDSKRRVSEYYMYVLVVLLVAIFARNSVITTIMSPLVLALVAIIAIDAFFIRRALRGLVAERLPGESARGLTWYAVMRALQARRFRVPAPRIQPGQKI